MFTFVFVSTFLFQYKDSEIGLHLITVTTFDPDTGVGGVNSFLLEVEFLTKLNFFSIFASKFCCLGRF